MNKIALTIALVFGFTFANAQDTTCTVFNNDLVFKFDYYKSEILYIKEQTTKYYDINVGYGNVLCLHLNDKKNKVRTVIITYFDNSTYKEVLDSKDNIYYSPQGTAKISVGKPKLAIKL